MTNISARKWKEEIRRRLASLKLEPAREAAIVEELSQHLDDCYEESLAGGATEAEAERRTFAELSESETLRQERSALVVGQGSSTLKAISRHRATADSV